ncbi:protein-glutamate O-methyltransferase CheR [Novosphingobium umbonatum]|uniref:Chemotaxis protein methyltransferase n=1 Tax=Novosphingobium umbonatum TaxID=1908524 RepID=A0A437NA98_9SPHN|nr:protein-glutamate O-methyltransferase CheR [Novosphingobium umbonatum]RVU06845.1 protein-glutamate O-methyltransferase CheR [Novosphingobium umbonatum]
MAAKAQALAKIAVTAPSTDGLSPRNFKQLSAFIYDRTGIRMPPSKQTMLEGRLRRRARALDAETLNEYCAMVLQGEVDDSELVHLINAVTTNKTDFFREPRHFDYLRNTLLPAYQAAGRRSISAWSAACSIGAEPYTLAMVLDDYAQAHGGPDYAILATDLDTNVLATAIRGIYSEEMLEPVPALLRQRYVMQANDRRRGEGRIVPELRSRIGFAQLNLMDSHYPIGKPVDMIFCRNVLIYFDKPTQQKVVSRLCDNLVSGGYLFLGHSESITGLDLPLTPASNTVFKRK